MRRGVSFASNISKTALMAELKECRNLDKGKCLHDFVTKNGYDSDICIANMLITMYGRCSCVDLASNVFQKMTARTHVSWNAMILGYAGNSKAQLALDCFSRMRDEGYIPNRITFAAALKACSALAERSGRRGLAMHSLASRIGLCSDMYVKSILMDMYAKCGCMDDACSVFDTMSAPDVVAWTSIMLGYVENGETAKALNLFVRMNREGCAPDATAIVAALKGCNAASGKEVIAQKGEALHLLSSTSGCDKDHFVKGALVDAYSKSGRMETARRLFDSIIRPDVVCWTVLILGYVDNGDAETALEMYSRMDCVPDERAFVAVIKACGIRGSLGLGREVHAEISRRGFEHNPVLKNCLVDFYARCGLLVEAEKLFDSHNSKCLVTWTSLMTAYSSSGDIKGMFVVFGRMRNAGVKPDGVTFNCILTACSHAGLVDEGNVYFKAMTNKYELQPSIEHYSCMLDMLSRANRLEDAMVLIRTMVFSTSIAMWSTVMAACFKWKNVQLGKLAFESLVSLDETKSRAYVLMANNLFDY